MKKKLYWILIFLGCWTNLVHAINWLPSSTPVQSFQQAEQNPNNINFSNINNLPKTQWHFTQNNTQRDNQINTASDSSIDQPPPFSMNSPDPSKQPANNILSNGIDPAAPAEAAAILAQAKAQLPSANANSQSAQSTSGAVSPAGSNQTMSPTGSPANVSNSPTKTSTNIFNNPANQQMEPNVPAVSTNEPGTTSKLDSVSTEVDQLNQQVLLFQQQNSGRLLNLEKKYMDVQNKLNELTLQTQQLIQQINLMNQEMSNLKNKSTTQEIPQKNLILTKTPLSFWQWIKHNIYYLVVGTVLVILLIIFLVMLFYGNEKKITSQQKTVDSKKNTFQESQQNQQKQHNQEASDSINENEHIAAQLDLARAYIAMDDDPSAYGVLQQVIETGTIEQQQEARNLLKLISTKKI